MAEANPFNEAHQIYHQIRDILTQARSRVYQSINSEMVASYWAIGRVLVEEEQRGEELTHQDIGQMQMYVNYYQREITNPDENPPIGIILCSEKRDAVVRFTLPEDNKQIFASRYKLYLPSEEELVSEIRRERQLIELRKTNGEVIRNE